MSAEDLEEASLSRTDMDFIYKLKQSDCYKWIFRYSRKRNGVREYAPKGHPFTIPIEEVDCSYCNSCEQ